VRRVPLSLLALVALVAGCGGGHHSATAHRPPADIRIYDATGHVRVEVTERDVVGPSVKVWRADGTTNITFELTTRGQRMFLRLTRGLARRGAKLHRTQHFALAVRGRVYSRPFIDYRASPNGLDATEGLSISNVRPGIAKRLADALRGARG
jgi:preprotein translocase subunit SecD